MSKVSSDSIRKPSFNQLVRSPDLWADLDLDALRQFAPRLFVTIATANDANMLPHLHGLYRLLVRQLSQERRGKVVDQIIMQLPSSPVAERALLPVILEEPESHIVSQAALELAMLMPLANNDPLTGPKYLAQFARQGDLDEHTKAGIWAGLLYLGDRRVSPLLAGCWAELSPVGQQLLQKSRSDFVYVVTMEFYLDWLEALEEQGPTAEYGAVAAVLGRLPFDSLQGTTEGHILDVERRFPATHFGGQPGLTILSKYTIAQYAPLLAPRLQDLARREQAPRVLPVVLNVWGIDPPDTRDFGVRAPEVERMLKGMKQ